MAATRREYYITGEDNQANIRLANWEAQTFTVGNVGVNENCNITSVKILAYRIGSPQTVYFAIKEVDEFFKPTGPDLSTGSVDPSGWTTNSAGIWYEVSMSSFTLEASTQYALVIRSPDSPNTSNCIFWKFDLSSSTYGGGEYIYSSDAGSSWAIEADRDRMFEIWGETILGGFPHFQAIIMG